MTEQISIIVDSILIDLCTKISENISVSSGNEYMNKKETCDYLKISNNTLDNWIDEGLPRFIIGGTTRYSKSEIDTWMNLKKVS